VVLYLIKSEDGIFALARCHRCGREDAHDTGYRLYTRRIQLGKQGKVSPRPAPQKGAGPPGKGLNESGHPFRDHKF
jgi:hypothetical protein